MFSSIVSSILTAGFGGSIGLEAPAASSASSLSSNLARMLHLNFKDKCLMVALQQEQLVFLTHLLQQLYWPWKY